MTTVTRQLDCRVWALRALTLLMLSLLGAGLAFGEDPVPVPNGQQAAIKGVIQSQIDAFQRNDGAAAFSYASPGIKSKFQTPDIFMAMVRQGYAAVYQPQEVQFLDARSYAAGIAQAVRFVGADGQTVVAIYMMEQQADGSWLIAGVQIIPINETTS